MAAAISALNAKIRSHPVLNYVCSTHFWGPVSNFGIPIAAVLDTQKDPELISGRMTAALTLYSATFMRYSMAVTPKNYLLFACHFVNSGAQITQGTRYLNYWNYGGREASLEARAKEGLTETKAEGQDMLTAAKVEGQDMLEEMKAGVNSAEQKGKSLAGDAKAKAIELKEKVVR